MKKLLKNSIKVTALFISLVFCVNAQIKTNDLVSSNEKIELVYNKSPVIYKRDNAMDKKKSYLIKNDMISIINTKLGIKYGWGRVGPNRFDCSGFVWKIFNEYKIYFNRSTARGYWKKFNAPEKEDNFKFGTLVFFSNLKHVGIVVDENGFYHASSSKGITYSKFNNYWKSRISGFRVI